LIDITDQLLRARQAGGWPVERIRAALPDDPAFDGLHVDWDDGEDWLRLLKTAVVVALAWAPGPFLLVTSGHQDLVAAIGTVTGTQPETAVVPHMNSPVLAVQPDRLPAIWADRDWPNPALDCAAMTGLDLWYATS
jgi:hypothetical protein